MAVTSTARSSRSSSLRGPGSSWKWLVAVVVCVALALAPSSVNADVGFEAELHNMFLTGEFASLGYGRTLAYINSPTPVNPNFPIWPFVKVMSERCGTKTCLELVSAPLRFKEDRDRILLFLHGAKSYQTTTAFGMGGLTRRPHTAMELLHPFVMDPQHEKISLADDAAAAPLEFGSGDKMNLQVTTSVLIERVQKKQLPLCGNKYTVNPLGFWHTICDMFCKQAYDFHKLSKTGTEQKTGAVKEGLCFLVKAANARWMIERELGPRGCVCPRMINKETDKAVEDLVHDLFSWSDGSLVRGRSLPDADDTHAVLEFRDPQVAVMLLTDPGKNLLKFKLDEPDKPTVHIPGETPVKSNLKSLRPPSIPVRRSFFASRRLLPASAAAPSPAEAEAEAEGVTLPSLQPSPPSGSGASRSVRR